MDAATRATATRGIDPAAAAIRAWRRRVRAALACGGFADGLAAVAIAGVAAILVLRLFGVHAAPQPLWAAAISVPLLAAWRRARSEDLSARRCALHLDGRLGLDGLLLSGLERDVSAWDARLEAGLAGHARVLPRVRWARAGLRGLVPVVALAGVCLLPAPAVAPERRDAALDQALDRFERRFEEIARHGGLRREAEREVRARVEALKERREDGKPPSWADLDALTARTDREAAERVASLARAKASLSAFARRGDGGTPGEAGREELAERLQEARASGLLEGLSPETSARLGPEDPSGGGPDASLLPEDDAALRGIAEALAATAGDRMDALGRLGVVGAADLGALDRLLEGDPLSAWREGERCRLCEGAGDDDCPG